jgi:hypothetical protein
MQPRYFSPQCDRQPIVRCPDLIIQLGIPLHPLTPEAANRLAPLFWQEELQEDTGVNDDASFPRPGRRRLKRAHGAGLPSHG